MSCPRCNSDDWKLADLVHKSGLSHVNTSTTTVGAGAGAGTGGVGVGAGAGVSSTSGQHQTELSALSAPPKEPKNTAGTVYWIIAFFLIIWVGDKSAFLGWLLIAGAFLLWLKLKPEFLKSHEQEVAAHQEALAKWEVTRVCQRCGTFYLPPQGRESLRFLDV